MELAMGAMASLAPKLGKLIMQEYVVQKGLKPDIESLSNELLMMKAALVDASDVHPDELSNVDKIWVRQLRDLSYDMEDAVDDFMVRVAGRDPAAATDAANVFKKIAGKVTTAMKKVKDRHQLADKIQDIRKLSRELAELRSRYTVRGPGANLAASIGVDPRVLSLYKKESDLVGIEEARDKVIRMLRETGHHDHASDQRLKIVSIVGFGGLGKTTLAKTVYDTLKKEFHCSAFFSVGRTPNMTRIFEKMLIELDKSYKQVDMARWDEEQFCNELHKFLQDKRYFIVIDDIWDNKSWETIRSFLKDSDCGGSAIIMTTRNFEVITKAEEVYRLKPLSKDNSKKLFYKRVQNQEGEGLDNIIVEVSSKILDQCGGIPLAIIAAASLLADKSFQEWAKVYDSIGFEKNKDNTMRILSYSYYDLPSYLKPCLLYLSIFPEDDLIDTYRLIWMWIAEGFVHIEEEGHRLFEIGERYFNELVNRSMIQVAEEGDMKVSKWCRIHDIVLDLILKLSREENFVTILSKDYFTPSDSLTGETGIYVPCADSKARRLTIQDCRVQHIPQDTMDRPEILRSLCILHSDIENMAPLCSFRACRVLFILDGRVPKINLKHLGKLRHLKCLLIYGRLVNELCKEIGQLKSLQTLILYYDSEKCLEPENLLPAICSLMQLLCLRLQGMQLRSLPAECIGNLVSLEQLHLENIAGRSATEAFVAELGKLTRLRVLAIIIDEVKPEKSLQRDLVQSLCNLRGLQELTLVFVSKDGPQFPGTPANIWEPWEPPRELRHLLIHGITFSRFPAWISSSPMPCLRFLSLWLVVVEVQPLDNLARFPELCHLRIYGLNWPPIYTVGTDGFKNLRTCYLPTLLRFDIGAMPRLEQLEFKVCAADPCYGTSEDGSLVPKMDAFGDLDFGLDRLRSLEQVTVKIDCYKVTLAQVQEAEAAVRRAVECHPNHPTLEMKRSSENRILSESDQQQYRHEQVQRHDAELLVSLRKIRDDEADVGFICALRSPASVYLQRAVITMDCVGASMRQVEKVEAALRHAADVHHNRPTLQLIRINTEEMASSSDHPNIDQEDHHDDPLTFFSNVRFIR